MAAEESPGPSLPRGTVTLVLGDIEGSVSLWQHEPDAMTAASRRLHGLVATAVGNHGGVRPIEQGEGDSFVLAFTRASDAVAATLELQRGIAGEPWPGDLTIRVRMGVHTGEVGVRDDRFYEGATINRCARVRDLGHGGQILISQATRNLLAEHVPDGAWLGDLGRHQLRGFEHDEQVYALQHPDLPAPFPPLHGRADGTGAPAVSLTTLVGRDSERQQVLELLGRARLVTLTGAGGVGKTRLAAEVAREVAATFDAGTSWVDLVPLAEPRLLASTVAAALGVRESTSEDVLDTVVREVGGAHRLIVLDNCEHLVDACAHLVAGVLTGCPHVVVLVTSREPLDVDGEAIYRVPSLPVPHDDVATLEELRTSDAARLFLDRASLLGLDVAYGAEDVAAIAGIARHLDGIPLAIELAAARTRLLTPTQILDGLADRFSLLTAGSRTAMPHQRTLEASMDWSYQLLDAPERTLLARLSVFAGSFDLDAATAVCEGGPIQPANVLDLMSHLVDHSLVQVEHADGEARYRLLETVRAYAHRKLADAEEAPAVRDRHLDHYVALAESAERQLRSHESTAWFVRLDHELANLRAAMDWALTSGQADKQLRISGGVLVFWLVRGLYAEIGLRMASALDASQRDPAVRARVLSAASLITIMSGNFRGGQALAREGVELSRELGDDRSLQQSLEYLGWSSFFVGDQSLEHLEEALHLAEEFDDPVLLRLAWFYLAVVRAELVRLADAQELFDRSLAAAAAAGDRYFEGVVGYFLGFEYLFHGRLAEAAEVLQRAVRVNRGIQNDTFLVVSASTLAYVDALRGRRDAAVERIREATRLARRVGHFATVFADYMDGAVQVSLGPPAAAVPLLADVADRCEGMGNVLGAVSALQVAAEGALLSGDLEATRSAVREAEALNQGAGYRHGAIHLRRIRGRVALLEGDAVRAADLLHQALDGFRDRDDPLGTIQALEALAEIASAQGDHARAARLLGATDAAAHRSGFAGIDAYGRVLERVLDEARGALGSDGLGAAQREGAALSLDEAVAYARRGRGERGRPSAGWDALTPAELDVVQLVAEGLSNPQMAERLFVSRNTVKTHLSSVYGKLGVNSRAQLAAEAIQHGISPTSTPQDHPSG